MTDLEHNVPADYRCGFAAIVGRPAGPVRAPLPDCTPAEVEELRALIEALGPQ